jgi:hypothetical protein
MTLSVSKGHPVGRVLIAALLGLIVGAIAASVPNYGTVISVPTSSGSGWVDLAPLVRAIAMIVGMASGGVIGAIAGLASNSRLDRPLIPLWVWIVFAAIFFFLFAGVLLFTFQRAKTLNLEQQKALEAIPALEKPVERPGNQ